MNQEIEQSSIDIGKLNTSNEQTTAKKVVLFARPPSAGGSSLNISTLNEELVQKSSKFIKSHLLQAQVARPSTQESLRQPIIISNPPVQIKHIDAQRSRQHMQTQVQRLYNRVLLLEKENKQALRTSQLMHRNAQKIISSQQAREQRRQQNDRTRMEIELNRQYQKQDNYTTRLQMSESIERGQISAAFATQRKASLMKQIHEQTKADQQTLNLRISMQNSAAFSTQQSEEKNNKLNRLLTAELNRSKQLQAHNAKAREEARIRAQQEAERDRLKQLEATLLAKLAARQEQLSSAVSDMETVIKLKSTQINTAAEIAAIKQNLIPPTPIPIEVTQLAQTASENFLDRIQPQPKISTQLLVFPSSSHGPFASVAAATHISQFESNHSTPKASRQQQQQQQQQSQVKPIFFTTASSATSWFAERFTTREDFAEQDEPISNLHSEEQQQEYHDEDELVVGIKSNQLHRKYKSATQANNPKPSTSASVTQQQLQGQLQVKVGQNQILTKKNTFTHASKTPSIEFKHRPQTSISTKPSFTPNQSTQQLLSISQSNLMKSNSKNFSLVCPPSNFLIASIFSPQKLHAL